MGTQRKSFQQLLPMHRSELRIEVASGLTVAELRNSIVAELKLSQFLRHGGKLKLMRNAKELPDGLKLKRLSSPREVACAHKLGKLVIDMIKVPLSFKTRGGAHPVRLPGVYRNMGTVGGDDYRVLKKVEWETEPCAHAKGHVAVVCYAARTRHAGEAKAVV